MKTVQITDDAHRRVNAVREAVPGISVRATVERAVQLGLRRLEQRPELLIRRKGEKPPA